MTRAIVLYKITFSSLMESQQSPGSQAVPKKRSASDGLPTSRLSFDENGDNEMNVYEPENVG